jgi:uncharacterized membrane protein YhhN
MDFSLIWISTIIAIVDWGAVAKRWKPLEYVAKPGVMIALLAWLWSIGGFSGHLQWFAYGLVFSLIGDTFLMLPKKQFNAALMTFLIAHVAYSIGFNDTVPPLNLVSIILAVMVGTTTIRLAREILSGLDASGNSKLRIPVLLYIIVISVMLLSALLTLVRPEWSVGPALLVSAGALLFTISDMILAWNMFVAPLRYEKLTVITSYHIGQILIILGAGLHYLST